MLFNKVVFCSIFFLLVSLVGFSVNGVEAADVKIGVLNTQKILAVSAAGKKRTELLKAKAQEIQDKLDQSTTQEKNAAEAIAKELQEKGSLMDNGVKEGKRIELIKLQSIMKQKEAGANRELRTFEIAQTEPILKKLDEVLKAYSEKNAYTIVLDQKGGVVFASHSIDITDDLIKELDAVMQ